MFFYFSVINYLSAIKLTCYLLVHEINRTQFKCRKICKYEFWSFFKFSVYLNLPYVNGDVRIDPKTSWDTLTNPDKRKLSNPWRLKELRRNCLKL